MPTTISSFLPVIKKRLQTVSGDLFEREAETIFQQVLNLPRNDLYLRADRQIDDQTKIKIEEIVEKRVSGVPLQYAIGEIYFYSSNFKVNKDVLIPRPDTETLIETVLKFESNESKFFADIGTGSGIITQILLTERSEYQGIAIDISKAALKTASHNIDTRGLLLCCDKFEAIKPKEQFDFIVSNPPYISTDEMKTLESCVLDHEPHNALWGGAKGLDFYKYFSKNLSKFLKNEGSVYFEIGHLQGEAVSGILKNDCWHSIEIIKDLANRDRVVKARRD